MAARTLWRSSPPPAVLLGFHAPAPIAVEAARASGSASMHSDTLLAALTAITEAKRPFAHDGRRHGRPHAAPALRSAPRARAVGTPATARGPVREWAVPTPSRHELLLARDSWAVEGTHLGVGQSTPRSRPRAARHEQVLDDAVTAPGHVLGARPSRLRGRRDRSSSATNSHESQSRVRPRSAPPWSGSVPQATASTLLERAKAYGRTPAGAQTQLRSRVRPSSVYGQT